MSETHNNKDGLVHFYNYKSVQPTFLFYVTIEDDGITKFLNGGRRTPLNGQTERDVRGASNKKEAFGQDCIREWMVASCEIPFFKFSKQKQQLGPFVNSFPILDHDGFEFTIKFEEDNHGTIHSLIEHFSNRNIDKDGYYRPKEERYIGADAKKGETFKIKIERNERNLGAWDKTFTTVYFKNVYFLTASTASFSYDATAALTFDLTFNCDYYEIDYGDEDKFSYEKVYENEINEKFGAWNNQDQTRPFPKNIGRSSSPKYVRYNDNPYRN
jgi:hypothetical protein